MSNDSIRGDAITTPASGGSQFEQDKPPRRSAIASLIVGASALLTGFVPVLGLIVGIAAIVLGVLALAKRQPKGFSIAGIALGSVGALTSLLMTVAIATGDFSSSSKTVEVAPAVATVEMPDIVGDRADKAMRQVEKLDLVPELVVSGTGGSGVDTPKEWKVEATDPTAGDQVEPGRQVKLTVVPRDDKQSVEPQEAPADPEQADGKPASNIEVLDMSYEGNRFVSATFPVSDAFTKAGVIRNLQDGCVEAIQTAKDATPDWYDFDTVQCMGMMDGTLLVGSANFSGTMLAEISDVAMQDDPEGFWAAADRSNIVPAFQ